MKYLIAILLTTCFLASNAQIRFNLNGQVKDIINGVGKAIKKKGDSDNSNNENNKSINNTDNANNADVETSDGRTLTVREWSNINNSFPEAKADYSSLNVIETAKAKADKGNYQLANNLFLNVTSLVPEGYKPYWNFIHKSDKLNFNNENILTGEQVHESFTRDLQIVNCNGHAALMINSFGTKGCIFLIDLAIPKNKSVVLTNQPQTFTLTNFRAIQHNGMQIGACGVDWLYSDGGWTGNITLKAGNPTTEIDMDLVLTEYKKIGSSSKQASNKYSAKGVVIKTFKQVEENYVTSEEKNGLVYNSISKKSENDKLRTLMQFYARNKVQSYYAQAGIDPETLNITVLARNKKGLPAKARGEYQYIEKVSQHIYIDLLFDDSLVFRVKYPAAEMIQDRLASDTGKIGFIKFSDEQKKRIIFLNQRYDEQMAIELAAKKKKLLDSLFKKQEIYGKFDCSQCVSKRRYNAGEKFKIKDMDENGNEFEKTVGTDTYIVEYTNSCNQAVTLVGLKKLPYSAEMGMSLFENNSLTLKPQKTLTMTFSMLGALLGSPIIDIDFDRINPVVNDNMVVGFTQYLKVVGKRKPE